MRLHSLLAGLLITVQLSANAQQDTAKSKNSTVEPSMELLEFLADFGDVDDATFDIIEFHANKDLMNSEGDISVSEQQLPEVANDK